MKVLIVSDTHGREDNLEKVLEKESPIDAMVHLGDVEGSEDYIRILTDAPVYMVAGNNDFYTDLPGQAVIDLDGYRAFITHGHGYHVSYSPNRLVAEALHRNAQIAMYGHTHVPHLEQVEGVIVLNPGSLSYPRQAGREPSYIIMETTPDKQVHFDIRYLRAFGLVQKRLSHLCELQLGQNFPYCRQQSHCQQNHA